MIKSINKRLFYRVAPLVLFALCNTGCKQTNEQPALLNLPEMHPSSINTFKTVCAGSAEPTVRIIFLQGITTELTTINDTAINYTDMLDAVGKELGVRFAMPYSNVLCKSSGVNYCWGTEEPESVARVYAMIRQSAAACFSLNQPWGVLGFSNGGYHVGRVITQGHTPLPAWAMAVGSAGMLPALPVEALSRGTPFYLVIGQEDITRDKTWNYFNELKKQGFNVRYDELTGGHELTEETLRTLVERIVEK